MRVLVSGGRYFQDREAIVQRLDQLHAAHGIELVLHGAALVDLVAAERAREHGVRQLGFRRKDWRHYGPAADLARNHRMLARGKPDLVITFPGGAGDLCRLARAAGVQVELARPRGTSDRD